MAMVQVVDVNDVKPRPGSDPALRVRPTLGPQTGFAPLEQAVLDCEPGKTDSISVGAAEETLYTLAGRGTLHAGDGSHPLQPEVGVCLGPGSEFQLENPGPETLRLIAVRVPDPQPADDGPKRPLQAAISRLADRELEEATSQRQFRIVADPGCGLRSATHFVGYIPTARAPDHFHTYDEVIYVLDGEGVMHAGKLQRRLEPGSCVQLPARTVHCLENAGTEPMRVVAVFRPAGSPAAAYYPDGTPASQGAEA